MIVDILKNLFYLIQIAFFILNYKKGSYYLKIKMDFDVNFPKKNYQLL